VGAGQGRGGRAVSTVGPWNRKWPEAAAALRGRIQDGTLEPGAVALIGDLREELGIGDRTAARAMCALAAEGLVERRPGIGYVVTARPG
jgi:DNA-binding GntR family transcriptional regulator